MLGALQIAVRRAVLPAMLTLSCASQTNTGSRGDSSGDGGFTAGTSNSAGENSVEGGGSTTTSAGASTLGGSGGSNGSLPVGGSGGDSLVSGGGGGTGGSAGGAGSAGTSSAPATCPDPPPAAAGSLFDFEDSATPGMYVYVDRSGAGTSTPASVPDGVVAPGADGTTKAFRFTGSNFAAASYGGGFGMTFSCRDASAMNGVRLWLKTNVDIAVTVAMPADTGAPYGDCEGDSSSCVSPYHVVPSTSGGWSLITIAWSNLADGAPAAFDASAISGLGFGVRRPGNAVDGWGWDVEVDQIELY